MRRPERRKAKETTSISVMTETAARLGLKDADLLRGRCYIDGQWIDADSGKTIDVTNPADGSMLGTVPKWAPAETAPRHRSRASGAAGMARQDRQGAREDPARAGST